MDVLNIGSEVEKNGFAVIQNFLTNNEIEELKNAGKQFSYDALEEPKKSIFDTHDRKHHEDQYFLDSAEKISYFYETGALDSHGTLKVEPEVSLNKVGHALHWLHPVFKKITFSQKVQNVCKYLHLVDPVIPQSMFIYKNSGIGGEVTPHQDSTYLYTTPNTLYGFWIALDDATEENGCLWFIPGSHKNGIYRRVIRNTNREQLSLLASTGDLKKFEDSLYVPVPVKKGTCIVIHGNVVHQSFVNKSLKSRNAYTFHIYDQSVSKYAEENWLQGNFKHLYYSN